MTSQQENVLMANILYHYTTAEGLQGIIKTKSIWASDYRFLNDTTEFNYGLSIFKDIFDESKKELPSDVVELIDRLKDTSEVALLITSFCECGDRLSQWRGYNGAIGYAIGLNSDWLSQSAAVQDFHLVPAIYKAADQRRIIDQKLGLLKKLLEEDAERNRSSWETVKEWWTLLLMTVAALKDENFKEEMEWRLVRATDEWPIGICTRAVRSGLVPYLPVKLDAIKNTPPLSHPRNVGIERIIVGPGLSHQQIKAVQALSASKHMRFDVVKSGIPYDPKA
jgi:hypothetical protein